MGTWGTGIFDDDIAADIRGDWRDALLDGLEADEATERLVNHYRDLFDDRDEQGLFWIALAAAQSETGRLLSDVRERALEIIDAGGDVSRFAAEDPTAGRQRAKALGRLAERLRGPQRAPTRLRRPKPRLSPLAIGDVVRVRGRAHGSEGLFVVVDHAAAHPPGSTQPVVAALLWRGGEVPSSEQMAHLPLIVEEPDGRGRRPVVHLSAVMCPPRGKLALENFGEVVASGVARPDAPDYRRSDAKHGPALYYSSWLSISGWVGGPWYERCVELTRREASSRRGRLRRSR